MGNALRCAFLLLSLLACSRVLAEASAVPFAGRESALKPEQIAVVVNDADLDSQENVGRIHLAEALSYRALSDDLRRAA